MDLSRPKLLVRSTDRYRAIAIIWPRIAVIRFLSTLWNRHAASLGHLILVGSVLGELAALRPLSQKPGFARLTRSGQASSRKHASNWKQWGKREEEQEGEDG